MEFLTSLSQRTDHEPVANTALTTKVKKDRLLSENTFMQAAISTQLSTNLLVPAPTGTSASKIQNRLLSSKVLATEVASAVEDLKVFLQPKDSAQEEAVDNTDNIADELSERPKKARKLDSIQTKEDNGGGRVALGVDNGTGWESESDEDPVDVGWESGSVRSGTKVTSDEYPSSLSDSGSEDDDGQAVHEKPPPKPIRKESTIPNAKAQASVAESTFLPSLSVGFIRGDSDSEWSDSEAKTTDIRKNRRGQRARRAYVIHFIECKSLLMMISSIWEKKYGKNANHTKKQRVTMEASGRGRSLHPEVAGSHRTTQSKGPRGPGRGGKHDTTVQQHHQPADAGWGQRKNSAPSSSKRVGTSTRSAAQQPPQREERPLHPSWEAKKKQKEKQSAGILPPQGKKIKF